MNRERISATKSSTKTVLVVDDDVENRYVLGYALRNAGYVVHEAIDAHEALRLLKSSLPIDAVVTDVQMPGEIDGLLLAESVRATHPSVAIVVVSGMDIASHMIKNGLAFFMKPFKVEQILNHLDKTLAT